MSEAKHTPEPWWDESGVAHAKAPEWTPDHHSCVHPIAEGNSEEGDCARACACVNACEGMNPEAVPDLLKVCKDVASRMDRTVAVVREMTGDPVGWGGYEHIAGILNAAVAKAEGHDEVETKTGRTEP